VISADADGRLPASAEWPATRHVAVADDDVAPSTRARSRVATAVRNGDGPTFSPVATVAQRAPQSTPEFAAPAPSFMDATPVVVQRAEPTTEAAVPVPQSFGGSARTATPHQDTAKLADEIYERVERRLREDLLFERARKGSLADPL
jgi:hypothetical protein